MKGNDEGKLIVITAPLTESIDHAGYFVQMAMASMPAWMERVINKRFPKWQDVERNPDGSARYMPAGVRLLQASLLREFEESDVVACYPCDLDQFIGPRTRVVAVSTHNPLGVTFAAGVYTSMFGSSALPINSRYAEAMFHKIQSSPFRGGFKVIVGGSGGWQISKTGSASRFGVDCVVEGRAESPETLQLFLLAVRGEEVPPVLATDHPKRPDELLIPKQRTTFGVVEMTTGCGRRCPFCEPDLNPQIAFPKDRIMEAVRMNISQGNRQISLATEDMFIWGQVHTGVPFFFPNREALLDLFTEIVGTPGLEQHVLSHCTLAPLVVDPLLIKRLSDVLLPKSPLHLPGMSSHPQAKILSPLVGLETGSVRLAKKIMPGKALPFSIEDWPSVVLEGLRIANENNWFPVLTLMVGCPEETDEDVKATLDLVYEIERRRLFGFLVPSIFTPLHDTRMEKSRGVTESRRLSPLQWQLMMKCWKMNLRPGLHSWWGPIVWRLGALLLWAFRLRRVNGPAFTWPLLMFSGILNEETLARLGKIYAGRPLETKNRRELIASSKPAYRPHFPADNGDIPTGSGNGQAVSAAS
ncbi:MAG: radical SAM protein [Acidobacteriota bacterium]